MGSITSPPIEQGETLRVSDDFFIEARKANPPEVRLIKPAGDYRASPIEEVTVSVNADGEFGLNDVDLHYSVNGGDEKTVSMLKQKGAKQVDGSTVLSLEDFKLVPGDVVSIYATAKDARSESRTDMFFIQADPFEREFSQSQQAGGGGGGGGGSFGQGDQTEISQREKEIIAATWKQKGDTDKKPSKQEAAENAKFLSGVQSKLRDQAVSLAGRLEAPRAERRESGVQRFREGHDRGRRGHGSGYGQIAAAEVVRCHTRRAEGAAAPASRRSHLPRDSGGVRSARSGRWRRRRDGRPRSLQPVRSRTGHREESVRNRADGLVAESARSGDR